MAHCGACHAWGKELARDFVFSLCPCQPSLLAACAGSGGGTAGSADRHAAAHGTGPAGGGVRIGTLCRVRRGYADPAGAGVSRGAALGGVYGTQRAGGRYGLRAGGRAGGHAAVSRGAGLPAVFQPQAAAACCRPCPRAGTGAWSCGSAPAGRGAAGTARAQAAGDVDGGLGRCGHSPCALGLEPCSAGPGARAGRSLAAAGLRWRGTGAAGGLPACPGAGLSASGADAHRNAGAPPCAVRAGRSACIAGAAARPACRCAGGGSEYGVAGPVARWR